MISSCLIGNAFCNSAASVSVIAIPLLAFVSLSSRYFSVNVRYKKIGASFMYSFEESDVYHVSDDKQWYASREGTRRGQ